jgi:ABC-type phosphate transport system substrate-binding protein
MRVSLPLPANGGRVRVAVAAFCAMALMAIVVAGSPAPARAALLACEGGKPTGETAPTEVLGSSLQKTAQATFWNTAQIYHSEKAEAFGCGPVSSTTEVKYESKSSGCGLDAMGAGLKAEGCGLSGGEKAWQEPGYRDQTVRIGASDFAPDPEEEANIDKGPTGGQHEGKIHVIPVAAAAITVVVHFPEGCTLKNPALPGGNEDTTTGGLAPKEKGTGSEVEGQNNDPTGEFTDDSAANETLRLHLPAQALEEIWEHHITKWGEIPTPSGKATLESGNWLEGSPTGQDSSYTCYSAPIYRIARYDTSGTSYNFKAYLSLLPSFKEDGGTALWKEGQVGSTNTAWPLANATGAGIPAEVAKEEGKTGMGKTKPEGGGAEVTAPTNECTLAISPNQICRANAEGGGSLSNAVIATDGSIGYLDLATAREKGYTIEAKTKDDTYWLPLQAVNPNVSEPSKRIVHQEWFYEPTEEPVSHIVESKAEKGAKGANCGEADFRGWPAVTSSDPDPTLGDWSKAIATGGSAYPICAITYDLTFDDDSTVYGTQAPEEAVARTVKDYLTAVTSPLGQGNLPRYDYGLLPLAVREIAEKGVAAIGWEKTSGSSGSKEETKTPSATTTTTTPAVITSVIPSNAFSIASAKVKGKDIVLSLVLPDAGKVQVKATGGGVTVGSASAGISGGKGTVTLAISKAALSKLAKAKGHKLSVKITVTFTPTGGTAASQVKTLTLTQAAVTPPKKKTSKKGKKK